MPDVFRFATHLLRFVLLTSVSAMSLLSLHATAIASETLTDQEMRSVGQHFARCITLSPGQMVSITSPLQLSIQVDDAGIARRTRRQTDVTNNIPMIALFEAIQRGILDPRCNPIPIPANRLAAVNNSIFTFGNPSSQVAQTPRAQPQVAAAATSSQQARGDNASPSATACDILTSHPDDRQRVSDSVPITERDPARAIPACEEALRADPNNPRLRYQLGLALDTSRRFTDSFASYQQAARAGYVAAGHALGWAYSSGEGIERNDAEAVRWYRWAAERGHTGSMNTLGVMMENGRGMPRDLVQAAEWYRRAYSTDGRLIAAFNLARLLAAGRDGVPQDRAQAVQLFRVAVQAGRSDAALHLALMAERGEAPQVSPTELIQLLVLAETGSAQRDRALRSINQQIASGNAAAVDTARRAVAARAEAQQREQEATRQRRDQAFARVAQPAVSAAQANVAATSSATPSTPSPSQIINPASSRAALAAVLPSATLSYPHEIRGVGNEALQVTFFAPQRYEAGENRREFIMRTTRISAPATFAVEGNPQLSAWSGLDHIIVNCGPRTTQTISHAFFSSREPAESSLVHKQRGSETAASFDGLMAPNSHLICGAPTVPTAVAPSASAAASPNMPAASTSGSTPRSAPSTSSVSPQREAGPRAVRGTGDNNSIVVYQFPNSSLRADGTREIQIITSLRQTPIALPRAGGSSVDVWSVFVVSEINCLARLYKNRSVNLYSSKIPEPQYLIVANDTENTRWEPFSQTYLQDLHIICATNHVDPPTQTPMSAAPPSQPVMPTTQTPSTAHQNSQGSPSNWVGGVGIAAILRSVNEISGSCELDFEFQSNFPQNLNAASLHISTFDVTNNPIISSTHAVDFLPNKTSRIRSRISRPCSELRGFLAEYRAVMVNDIIVPALTSDANRGTQISLVPGVTAGVRVALSTHVPPSRSLTPQFNPQPARPNVSQNSQSYRICETYQGMMQHHILNLVRQGVPLNSAFRSVERLSIGSDFMMASVATAYRDPEGMRQMLEDGRWIQLCTERLMGR